MLFRSPLSIKKQREMKKKGQSGMDFNWNSLYMNVSYAILEATHASVKVFLY